MGQTAQPFDDAVLRAAGVLGLFGIALIHFLDVFGKFSETPYLGVAYVFLMAMSVGAALRLVHSHSTAAWVLAGTVAALTILGYVLSRTTGLPGATDDIGNWEEPLGLASLFVEGAVVVLSAYALALRAPRTSGRARGRVAPIRRAYAVSAVER
ncbi:MAG TPA: hypothetical protein VIB48_11500 [Acidimicrobiia bacterium]|jgi:hypothetical protein